MSAVIAPEAAGGPEQLIWALLAEVPDPEIPVLSIVDLGTVRHVRQDLDGRLHVGLTPTYSGCPATEVIRVAVRAALDAGGYADAVLEEVLSPPWTTEWLTSTARANPTAFGIAPPEERVLSPRRLWQAPLVNRPRCGSRATERGGEVGAPARQARSACTTPLAP